MLPFGPVIGGVIVTAGVGLGLGFLSTVDGNIYSENVDKTKTFSAREISTLHLDVDAADVHVLHGDGAMIRVHVYGGADGQNILCMSMWRYQKEPTTTLL